LHEKEFSGKSSSKLEVQSQKFKVQSSKFKVEKILSVSSRKFILSTHQSEILTFDFEL